MFVNYEIRLRNYSEPNLVVLWFDDISVLYLFFMPKIRRYCNEGECNFIYIVFYKNEELKEEFLSVVAINLCHTHLCFTNKFEAVFASKKLELENLLKSDSSQWASNLSVYTVTSWCILSQANDSLSFLDFF